MKLHLVRLLLGGLLMSGIAGAAALPTQASMDNQVLDNFLQKMIPQSTTGDNYLQFQNAGEALEWIKKVGPLLAKGTGANKFQVLELTDARYSKLQAYVRELWNGYTELFADETATLTEPPVVLVESEAVNAFVPKDPVTKKIAHVIVVYTALIDAVGGIDQKDPLTGMFAHELAHSVFKHLLPQFQTGINKFFFNSRDKLGFHAVRDAKLDETMNGWVDSATLSGDLTYQELLNLPSLGMGQPIFARVWKQIVTDLFDKSMVCQQAGKTLEKWIGFTHPSKLENIYSILTSDLKALGQTGDQLIQEEKQCIADKRKPFIDLLTEVLGVPTKELEATPGFKKMAEAFDRASDPVEGIRTLVTEARQKMVAAEIVVPLSGLGHFTYEEHADDVSLIVHRYMGRDPESLSKVFKVLMVKDDPKLLAECETLMKSATPAPGAFSDPHRALCYRIHHLHSLEKLIEDEKLETKQFAKQYISETIAH